MVALPFTSVFLLLYKVSLDRRHQIPDSLSAGWLRADVQVILPVIFSETSIYAGPGPYRSRFALNTFLPMFQQTFNLPWPTVTRIVSVKIEGAAVPINITVCHLLLNFRDVC